MTLESGKPSLATRAIKERAVEWLERSEGGNFGEEDHKQLERWLAESPSHRIAFWHAKSAWERAGRLQILQPRFTSDRRRTASPRNWVLLARSAAVVAVLALAGAGAAWVMDGDQTRALTTGHGERETVSLADGSKIELNTDTEVRVGVRAGQRVAVLVRGEAYFQIEHDAAHPFTVVAGDHRVRDLGTKFLVRITADALRVALLDGRAQVETAKDSAQRPVLLVPGDVAIANASGIRVSRKPAQELTDALAWRHGGLVFRNASLADAVAQFNRYGNVRLVIADPAAAALTINGAFRTAGAENFAGVAHEIFGLRVVRHDNEIVLSR